MTRSARIGFRLLSGYLIVILLLGITGVVATLGTRTMEGRITHVVEADDALISNLYLQSKLMDDEETSLRGYLLTRSRQFLAPYLTAQQQLPALAEQSLRLSSTTDLGSRPVIAAMARRNAAWGQWAGRILVEAPHSSPSAAAMRQQLAGKRLFDRYRAASSTAIALVSRDRSHQLALTRRTDTRLTFLFIAFGVLALLVTAMMAVAVTRAVTGPLSRLGAAASAIGSGELGGPVTIRGAREFQFLAAQMDDMRLQLVATAGMRDQTEELLRSHVARLSTLIETQTAVTTAQLDLDAVLDLITERAQSLTQADGAVVEMVDDEEMVYRAVSGTATPHRGLRLKRDGSLSGLCTDTEEILQCTDADTDPRVDADACRRVGLRSMIVVPLHSGGAPVGALKVLSAEPHAFHDYDVDTLLLLAGQIGGAIATAFAFAAEHARMQERSEAAEQLSRANSELESFAYSVSHDLRAPLRSMDGFSQVLMERYADQLDERGMRYLNHVRDAAQDMGRLIDALLQLSRVARAEARRERLDLSELAVSIVADLRRTNPGSERTVMIAEAAIADGDPRLLRAALENLLGNAWKFTGKRERACIEFGVTHDERGPVYFVRDNGAGFDMTYANKLFAPFQRLHSTADYEGTGVGLATVQRIIQRHGGRIWAEGAVGQGATFYFTLAEAEERAA